MSRASVTPLSADLIMVAKGSAAPVAMKPREPAVTVESKSATPRTRPKVEEAIVTHNFRVRKSFKRAFDQAAFDADMTGVAFLQHIFEAYQKKAK